MKVSNDAREQMLQEMVVQGIEVIEGDGSEEKTYDKMLFHLANGCTLSIGWHPINGLLVRAMKREDADPIRTGLCTCPERPFGSPPVFSPSCPQHKELIGPLT